MKKLPKGINQFFFHTFFDYTMLLIIMHSTMILYLQKLGAPAVLLGLPVSLFFIMDILQIPAANHVDRIGYKKFVLTGWILQGLFIFCILTTSLLPMTAGWRILWIGILLFLFNFSRASTYCAVLPWFTHLIPENIRGKIVSQDQVFRNTGMIVSNLAITIYFYFFSDLNDFAPLFAYALLAVGISFLLFRRIPDTKIQHEKKSQKKVSLKEIWNHRPFRTFLIFCFFIVAANGGGMVFYISFLKELKGVSDFFIPMLGIFYGIAAIITLPLAGKAMDRVGSRPILIITNVLFIIHFAGWGLVAAGFWPLSWPVIIWQQFSAGISFAVFNAATIRMAMVLAPKEKRSRFFAAFNVVKNLTLGCAPFFWGIIIDSLKQWQGIQYTSFEWNRFSVFYTLLVLTLTCALIYSRGLSEEGSMKTRTFLRELFVKTPSRAMARLWDREDTT